MSEETFRPAYPFTEDEFRDANADWGCNCGPSALAFALSLSLDKVRPALPEFEQRGYTNPTMMRQALVNLNRRFNAVRAPSGHYDMFHEEISLVRIQWTGPWTTPKPARWAARYTHWIAAWLQDGGPTIFDCNGGIRALLSWEVEIAPLLMGSYKDCDGWRPANVWRLKPPAQPPRPITLMDSLVDKACGVTQ